MKTKLFKLMATMFVAVLSLGFTSCGDDEDENNPQRPDEEEVDPRQTEEATIVGSWKWNFDIDGYEIVTFYANGTGQTYEWDDSDESIKRFLYSFDKDHMRLTITVIEEEDASGRRVYEERETETYTVIEFSQERLIILDWGDEGFSTLVPYKGDVITSLYKQ
ncbi:MAG: hypothetical protein IJ692_02775 [Alloprevotella sp.]|nr:hypothetical protein [Alloprevotella sp.]